MTGVNGNAHRTPPTAEPWGLCNHSPEEHRRSASQPMIRRISQPRCFTSRRVKSTRWAGSMADVASGATNDGGFHDQATATIGAPRSDTCARIAGSEVTGLPDDSGALEEDSAAADAPAVAGHGRERIHAAKICVSSDSHLPPT
jgi:hypothetical protein